MREENRDVLELLEVREYIHDGVRYVQLGLACRGETMWNGDLGQCHTGL
jgi:hypothetical protein